MMIKYGEFLFEMLEGIIGKIMSILGTDLMCSSLNSSRQHRTMQWHIIPKKQTNGVIITATNILWEIIYQRPHHSSDPHRL